MKKMISSCVHLLECVCMTERKREKNESKREKEREHTGTLTYTEGTIVGNAHIYNSLCHFY